MRCAGCSIRNEVDAAAVLVRQSCRRGAVQLAEAVPLIDAAAGAWDPVHGVTAFQGCMFRDSMCRCERFYEKRKSSLSPKGQGSTLKAFLWEILFFPSPKLNKIFILFNSLCSSETSSLSNQKPPLEALRASNGGKEQNNGFVSNRNRIVFPPADSTSGRRDIVQRRGDATASAGTLPRPSDMGITRISRIIERQLPFTSLRHSTLSLMRLCFYAEVPGGNTVPPEHSAT